MKYIPRTAIALTLVTAAALALAGCSPAVAPIPTPSHATKVIQDASNTVTKITTPPGSTKGYVGARKDVTVTSCSAKASPATIAGKVTNPTADAQSYRIYVSVLASAKTLGVVEVDVDGVAANATKPWSTSLAVGAPAAQCVLRVERNPTR